MVCSPSLQTCVEVHPPGAGAHLADVGRLRYDVYIAEMGKRYEEADHVGRTLLDELDPISTHFFVHGKDGRLVAALRHTPLGPVEPARLRVEGLGELWGDRELLERCSLSSRLVLDRSVRGSLRQLPAMIEAIYTDASRAGTLLNFLHCHHGLGPFFARVGFRPVASDFFFVPTGKMHHRLCLQTDAVGPLEEVGSHLAVACRRLFDGSSAPRSGPLLTRARQLLGAAACGERAE